MLGPLLTPGSDLADLRPYLDYDAVSAALTAFVRAFTVSTATSFPPLAYAAFGMVAAPSGLTDEDTKWLNVGLHLYRFLPRALTAGEREEIVAATGTTAIAPADSASITAYDGMPPTLFFSNTSVGMRDCYNCWRHFATTRWTVAGSQSPFSFMGAYDASELQPVTATTQDARVEAARAQARARAGDVLMLLVACAVRDKCAAIRAQGSRAAVPAADIPFEVRMGLVAAASGTPIPATSLVPAVTSRARRVFVVPLSQSCLEGFTDRMSFPTALKYNDKWQDAVDVITAKCRRSGIMTYVILVLFLVYLFGSIFVLRSGQPPSVVNASVGVTAALVCAAIVAYYLLQFFRWVKPPVWLP